MGLRLTASRIVGSSGLALLCASHVLAGTGDETYRTFRPEGSGPHPGAVFAPGCSGFSWSEEYVRLAEELRDRGYVVVFADYLGRRNIKVCDGGAVTQSEAGKDIVAAASWLGSQPSVDPTRIAVFAWSYGGGAVLAALAEHGQEPLAFSSAILYYPECRTARPWKVRIPVLMLFGSEDVVAPAKPCQQITTAGGMNDLVKVVLYPGAYHGFDNSTLPAKTTYRFGTIGFNPEAAAAAREEVRKFQLTTQ
jgi:dienelactone hydrolase